MVTTRVKAGVVSRNFAYNFKQSNTGKIRRALERAAFQVNGEASNYNNPVFIHAGDSTTGGAGSGTFNTGTYSLSYNAHSYPTRLAETLARRYGLAATDGYWGDRKNNGYDPRVTLGASWLNNSGQLSIAGYALNCPNSVTSTTNIDFTAATNAAQPNFDVIDIWYIQYSGGGTFTVGVDGSAALSTINSGSPATGALVKATVTGASLGTHTVNIARTTGGAVYIVGVVPRNSAIRQLINVNGGRGGWKAADYASTSNAWSPANGIAAVAPDGMFLNLGINEGASPDWNAYKASQQITIDKALLSGDVVLIVPHWTDTATVPLVNQQNMATAIYELAATNDLPVFDKQALYVDRATQSANGYAYDTLHNSYTDAYHMAWALDQALMSPW